MDTVYSEVSDRHHARMEHVMVNGHGVDFGCLIVEKAFASD